MVLYMAYNLKAMVQSATAIVYFAVVYNNRKHKYLSFVWLYWLKLMLLGSIAIVNLIKIVTSNHEKVF